ncbi:MAG: hypothetical protein ACRYFX_10070 [Janthinobacterium lividum]
MSAPLIIPDHIKQARLTLLGAGIPCEVDDVAFAALMFAAIAYNRTPQMNRAAVLRQELADAHHAVRRLTGEVLREGQRADRLSARLARLTKAEVLS